MMSGLLIHQQINLKTIKATINSWPSTQDQTYRGTVILTHLQIGQSKLIHGPPLFYNVM